jgi:hypothetical protein
MRKLITVLTAIVALAASAASFGIGADPAAAACARYGLHTSNLIEQSNGWNVWLRKENGAWYVSAYDPNNIRETYMDGDIRFDSYNANLVKFVITWNNGSGGIYTGSIDDNGFVSGTTVDRWNTQSRAYWHMREFAPCV